MSTNVRDGRANRALATSGQRAQILKDFPEELRADVSLHLHREVLSLPIFETAPQGFLKSLARHIESKFCCPT